MRKKRIGLGATYRLQLFGLGFEGAAQLVPYLSRLGIETLYLSPIAAARPGSTSGYDVIDPNRLDPDLGGEEGFAALIGALDRFGLGLLVDIVPNHLAASEENAFFMRMLSHGRSRSIFDVDWQRGGGKVVLPVLARPLREAVRAGELVLCDEGARRAISYQGRRFPLAGGGEARRQDDVSALLERQHYRLAYWRVAGEEVNYRRFFDINDLIAVRMEDPAVFEQTHKLIGRLLSLPQVAGLRVDHVDGLLDPRAYLERVRDLAPKSLGPPAIVVEKITARRERPPKGWPIEGLTGYEFADFATAVLTDGAGAKQLQSFFSGDGPDFIERVRSAKHLVIDELFPGFFDALARALHHALLEHEAASDLPVSDYRAALVAWTTALSVYRSYLEHGVPISPSDRRVLQQAASSANNSLHENERRAMALLFAVACADPGDAKTDRARSLLVSWQQLSGAVTAKGVEDTAFFAGATPLSGTEVGSDPDDQSIEPGEFHRLMKARARGRGGLNATSTHDTKRSEDVRARLAILSELPGEVEQLFLQLHELNEPHKTTVAGAVAPDLLEEWYLYQSVLGAWPVPDGLSPSFRRRIVDHMQKALREAKRHTNWLEPDPAYERAVARFCRRLLADANSRSCRLLGGFAQKIAPSGAVNSLSLTLLKITAPGIPDFYQGSELFSFLLTDPDNRRPVDFVRATRLLDRLAGASPRELLASWHDGRVKQYVTQMALQERRSHVELFRSGHYVPLSVHGEHAGHVLAFARTRGSNAAVTIVPRMAHAAFGSSWPLGAVWGSTSVELPSAPKKVLDVLSGVEPSVSRRRVRLAEVLGELPVSLLHLGAAAEQVQN